MQYGMILQSKSPACSVDNPGVQTIMLNPEKIMLTTELRDFGLVPFVCNNIVIQINLCAVTSSSSVHVYDCN